MVVRQKQVSDEIVRLVCFTLYQTVGKRTLSGTTTPRHANKGTTLTLWEAEQRLRLLL